MQGVFDNPMSCLSTEVLMNAAVESKLTNLKNEAYFLESRIRYASRQLLLLEKNYTQEEPAPESAARTRLYRGNKENYHRLHIEAIERLNAVNREIFTLEKTCYK